MNYFLHTKRHVCTVPPTLEGRIDLNYNFVITLRSEVSTVSPVKGEVQTKTGYGGGFELRKIEDLITPTTRSYHCSRLYNRLKLFYCLLFRQKTGCRNGNLTRPKRRNGRLKDTNLLCSSVFPSDYSTSPKSGRVLSTPPPRAEIRSIHIIKDSHQHCLMVFAQPNFVV